jgi:Zn-dependent membrane protease YugP
MYFGYDYIWLMLPAFAIVMLAQIWVSSAYSRWGKAPNASGISGGNAARRLLDASGLYDVQLAATRSMLGDHYDPRERTLRLSPAVAQDPTVASLAIAAHEVGHAQQHAEGYVPLQLRSAIVPLANVGSYLGWFMVIVGLLMGSPSLAWLGVLAFSLGAVFAFLTLPVELNASQRARQLLSQTGLIRTREEEQGISAVLNAAAFTYVAALAAALLNLLRVVLMVGGMGRRRS